MAEINVPNPLIAQSAVHPPDSCKLMVVDKTIHHKTFRDILNYIESGDVLVVNQTKVIPAKLVGKKSTGGKVEVILMKKINNAYHCRIEGRVHIGSELIFNKSHATVRSKDKDIYTIAFNSFHKTDAIIPT